MPYRVFSFFLLGGFLLILGAPAVSQTPAPGAKRTITHNDYNSWRSIQSPTLSPDGRYVAYAVGSPLGEGEFIVRDLTTDKEHRHSRGRGGIGGFARGRTGPIVTSSHRFTADGKSVLFPIYPGRADGTKGKATPTIGSTLGMMELTTGKVTRIEKIRSYQLSEESPQILAYLKENRSTPSFPKGGTPKTGFRPGRPTKGETRPTTPPTPPTSTATELVLRSMADGKERIINDVTEFSLTRDGKMVVYTVSTKDETKNGLFALSVREESVPMELRRSTGRISRLTWDEDQTQLVFFTTPKPAKAGDKTTPQIYHWKRPAPTTTTSHLVLPPSAGLAGLTTLVAAAGPPVAPATELVVTGKPTIQAGWEITENGGLSISEDGSKVYFALKPPAPKTTSVPGQVNVELWHYKDDFIQPLQKARYASLNNRTYQGVVYLNDRSCRQLADESMASINVNGKSDWAIGSDDRAYRILVGSQEVSPPSDAYLVNTRTGVKKLLAKKQHFPLTLSPTGKYVVSFDGKNWQSVSTLTGKRVNLTGKLKVSFVNELHDQPSDAPAYGLAGYTANDEHVLIHDRYDVWKIALDGSGTVNVTGGQGRKTETQFRLVRLDPKERTIDLTKPHLLRAENERTRDTGFYRLLPDGNLKLLLMGARNYSVPVKAKNSNRLLLTVSTFYDYPDLYTSDMDFREIKKISDANPQKANFVWGKAELITYKNSDGVALQSVLIKPENFDPKKKYPMIVYIYERLTQNLHRFVLPQAGTSINPTYYAGNGYLVLMPDITYTVGYPGQSAVKCVLPAIQAVVDTGCVNEKAIGIQGHSWGGYQTAYLITQTTRFKAAAAGAPVVNMTSAYGGIRWSSGLPRQFQYEKTQSRIGGTLWQYPTRFLENSPLFMADRVKTPLLMLHNDRDGAVPWQQGIEYYLALRRLDKEVYLFNYIGEDHGLIQRANQRDYTVRMQQFFDHYLKGAAKPDWMEKGLPYRPSSNPTPPTGGRTRTEGEE